MAKNKTWAQERMEELEEKGKKNWDDEDWEAYCYIQNVNAEADYYASMD